MCATSPSPRRTSAPCAGEGVRPRRARTGPRRQLQRRASLPCATQKDLPELGTLSHCDPTALGGREDLAGRLGSTGIGRCGRGGGRPRRAPVHTAAESLRVALPCVPVIARRRSAGSTAFPEIFELLDARDTDVPDSCAVLPDREASSRRSLRAARHRSGARSMEAFPRR